MTLFPADETFNREIESWRLFAEGLKKEDRIIFEKMLSQCSKFSGAINAKGELFPTESLLMSLILLQHEMIEFILRKK